MADRDPALDAVRWALGTYLDPQDAQQAATLWQPMAPGQSSLVGLSRFCRNVAQRFNLQGREAELHLHIIRALQRQKTATLPEGRPARPPDPPDDSAHVVRALVLAMQAQASEALGDAFDAPAWRQSAARHVSSARGSEAVKAQAQAWLMWPEAPLVGSWPARGSGTQLVNAAYVALAEWLGPVEADACLTRIVRHCERSDDVALRAARMYL